MWINVGDVVDGALVNAIALAGRRISVAVDGLRGRRRATDLSVARWFDTYHLAGRPPELPGLSPALIERLTDVLRGDEVQAALQELLAARLTDAPETDATAAKQVLGLCLAGPWSVQLADYYDDQICALVARLEADDPKLLAQVRGEAFSARMINILNAIERHTAALTTRPAQRTEASFLVSYRRHVIDQHGKLEPPDFDRRRRVPIADIYVPTVITEDLLPERTVVSLPPDQPSLTVYDLAGRLDRSVLLGDPGGGKTTAAKVLMHHFASDAAGRVPFLVTLRDYASADPPSRSVVGFVEHMLETFYQCPAPSGLVDLLLLTGRAVVTFDGLDELLDTTRRADVTTRVERFCAEYPLARVLVTSRVVGYDQARLDDSQFTCYRLGDFGDDQVAEYVEKWFAQDSEAHADEASAFLAESEGIRDLRSNPLLLSLMCILYRGEGSLPRGLRLAVSLDAPLRGSWGGQALNLAFSDPVRTFWREQSAENARIYAEAIITAARDHVEMRRTALSEDLITIEQALKMDNGLMSLFHRYPMNIFGLVYAPYLVSGLFNFLHGSGNSNLASDFRAVGYYLNEYRQPPWLKGRAESWQGFPWRESVGDTQSAQLDSFTYLGATAIMLIPVESEPATGSAHLLRGGPSRFGPFRDLYAYIEHRLGLDRTVPLPELPVPDEFKQVFRDWAEGRVDFTAQE